MHCIFYRRVYIVDYGNALDYGSSGVVGRTCSTHCTGVLGGKSQLTVQCTVPGTLYASSELLLILVQRRVPYWSTACATTLEYLVLVLIEYTVR